jgi:hypothetical protein
VNRKQWLALAGILVISLLLAFPLREAVHHIVVVPLAYVFWFLGLYYQSVPELLIWIGFLVLIVIIILANLIGETRRPTRIPDAKKEFEGPVERLSISFRKARRGRYYRWRMAHRLAKVARELLAQREGLEVKQVHANHLTGVDWSPPRELDEYFQAGLFSSFATFPRPRWWFMRPEPTPLDIDVTEAVDYLEKQIKADQ